MDTPLDTPSPSPSRCRGSPPCPRPQAGHLLVFPIPGMPVCGPGVSPEPPMGGGEGGARACTYSIRDTTHGGDEFITIPPWPPSTTPGPQARTPPPVGRSPLPLSDIHPRGAGPGRGSRSTLVEYGGRGRGWMLILVGYPPTPLPPSGVSGIPTRPCRAPTQDRRIHPEPPRAGEGRGGPEGRVSDRGGWVQG